MMTEYVLVKHYSYVYMYIYTCALLLTRIGGPPPSPWTSARLFTKAPVAPTIH